MARDHALTDFAARVAGLRGREKLDAAAAEAFSAFAAAGVDALLLKGPALARLLYGEGESRGYSDIDVLVDPAHLSRARTVLATIGYIDISDRLGIDDVAGVVHDESWVGPDPDAHRIVDLHRRLPGATAPVGQVWAALAAHRTSIELAGCVLPVLCREGLALHMATHVAQHGAGHARAIVDLKLGLERWSEQVWRDAAELAAQIGAAGAFATGLRLLPEGRLMAERLSLPRSTATEWALTHAASRPRGAFHLRALSEAEGPRALAGIARRALLPRRGWIVHSYPWARDGGPRLVAAYALHVARLPRWAARAWRYRLRERRAVD